MRIARSVQLLAADARTQIRVLAPIPENAAARDFVKTNSVYRMAWLYCASFAPSHGGDEPIADWIARTEIPPSLALDREQPFWRTARRLHTVIQMIFALDVPFHFSAHGLRNAPEWELARHLAAETCEAGGWPLAPAEISEISFDHLWTTLGAGTVDVPWFGG